MQSPVLDQGNSRDHAKSIAGARILYAEDDVTVRQLTSRVLGTAGCLVTTVDDGQAAWEALASGSFDLVITDNDMPRLTGIELVTRLRRNHLHLPVILASGSAGFFSGEEYRWLGFSACVQKPFALEILLEAVKRALDRQTSGV